MTYIIAEPCIDIKDLSCVDVCPVDCIHEAERILVIDPEECIDCFAPDGAARDELGTSDVRRARERVVSRAHRRRLQAGRHQEVSSQAARRDRIRARVRGAHPLRRHAADDAQRLALPSRPCSPRRRIRGSSRTASGPTSLEVGQYVPSSANAPKRDGERYRLGALHGLVFGDGSWNKQEIRSGEHLHYVQLYGEKVAKFKDFFDQVNFSPCLDVHPGYVGTGVVRASANLKRLLPETADPEYIAGFVDGWLASDGDQVKAGSWRLRSIDHEALAWLESAAPLAGYVAVGSGEEGEHRDELRRSQPADPLALPRDARGVLARQRASSRQESEDARYVLRRRSGEARVHARGRCLDAELRRVRTGVSGRGDLPRGCTAGEVGAVRQDQLRVRTRIRRREQADGRVRDRAQREERADRIARFPFAKTLRPTSSLRSLHVSSKRARCTTLAGTHAQA